MARIKQTVKNFAPAPLLSAYHFALALLGALWYRFPSRHLVVVGITGTKGKSSTAEILNAILKEAGHRTALLGTIRIKVGNESHPNLFKMTMPGRFFIQNFLRRAVSAGCDYAILEMTSEGAAQHRHRFVGLDALIFTNLAPEHIESHGSFEKYKAAKLLLRNALERSHKRNKTAVANADDPNANEFLDVPSARKVRYSLKNAAPYTLGNDGATFVLEGSEMRTRLVGEFSLYNILAAALYARALNIPLETISHAISRIDVIPGRAERIDLRQGFDVVVDYAHTKGSLEALYRAFPTQKKICVLGAAGGGRDRLKRRDLGAIADRYCEKIILTDEDPYDEDPRRIIDDVAEGIRNRAPEIIMDRREAIRKAFEIAHSAPRQDRGNQHGYAVLITGKGTDPFIMRARGAREPWSDKRIATEELRALLGSA